MMKEFSKNKNLNKKKKISGFVLLYTMILSSIILAVTFGVTNIALKETNFSISARAANDAFFAADTGAECALFYDKASSDAFSGAEISMECGGNPSEVVLNSSGADSWYFEVNGLGESQRACARVTLTRDQTLFSTTIVSKGYSNCDVNLGNVVERELKISY